MRVLVVGSGGREHALAWALARSPSVDEVISAPGNPGMAGVGAVEPIGVDDHEAIRELAVDRAVDLVVVGPEAPLVAGLADELREDGLTVFGPSAASAEIEGSKVYAQDFARRHGIPVARGEAFADPADAIAYARMMQPPVVVKAEGLAAGKGVLICEDHAAAERAVDEVMRERAFGDAGARVVVQEFLTGRETSIFALCDGVRIAVLEPAQDYKRALDDDRGLNTGGMGAYSPVPWLDADVRDRAVREIVERAVAGMAADGRPYTGCLYAGLMVTDEGPKMIEFNCRFGDPESQALLRRLDGDLGEILLACASGELDPGALSWSPDAAVCVVVASGGYPEAYPKGVPIDGIDDAEALDGVVVFQAGTATEDGRLVSSGGRVLNVTATGETIEAARDRAYEAVGRIRMEGMHHRTDIARDAAVAAR